MLLGPAHNERTSYDTTAGEDVCSGAVSSVSIRNIAYMAHKLVLNNGYYWHGFEQVIVVVSASAART